MHPPLSPWKHPLCLKEIDALNTCHAESPLGKFVGACNDHKASLDRCFRAEKQAKRSLNHAKAKAEQERLRARVAARRAEEAGAP